MSGIAGFVLPGPRPDGETMIRAMLEPMRRRGPDGRYAWVSESAAFGQALLSTTAEAGAERQPWVHPASGCVVVSDSRLDNRPELLNGLGLRGRNVDEVGDGELLHAAYQAWGRDCVRRLLGDFAFAIWDPGRRRLLCARDVMGVRPLFYHFAPGGQFAFASDTRSLLSLEGVPAQVDEGRVADALVGELEGFDDSSTFFCAIKRLPPAHTLVLEGNALRIERYWQPLPPRPADLPRSDAEWIEMQRFQLTQAVQCRLRASRRVGSMLSGGLDSSAVVAIGSEWSRANGEPRLAVFSAIDSGGDCAETRAIRSVISAFDLDPTLTDVHEPDAFVPAQRAFLGQLGEPFDGTMALISAQYHAAADAGVRCLLDGMPADNLYTTNDYAGRLTRTGHPVRAYEHALASHRLLQNRLPRLRAVKAVVGACAPQRLRDWRDAVGDRHFYRKELVAGSLIDARFAERIGLRDRHAHYQQEMRSKVFRDESGEALTSITAAYVTAAVERYGRAAAFDGVEPRHPYLDQRLIEFHAWVPQSLRFRGEWPKWLLRKALEGVLPDDVVWRRGKTHLGYRFNREVMQASPDLVREGCAAAAPYLDTERTKAALRAPGSYVAGLENAVLMGLWLGRYAPGSPTFATVIDSSRSTPLAV